MILTSNDIKNTLHSYSNKNTKISRDAKNGKLIKLKNGLYETNPNVKGYLLARSIYGPSYLSFEFALQYYGLIPDQITNYTSATCSKKRKKIFENKFGTYLYREIPERVFLLGVNNIEEEGYKIQIATPEKALCDFLYTLSPIKNMRELIIIKYKNSPALFCILQIINWGYFCFFNLFLFESLRTFKNFNCFFAHLNNSFFCICTYK